MSITDQTVLRPEYPRPQFVRSEWLCLNGVWQFEIDQGGSGLDRGLLERPLTERILVPFCPESRLSGIQNTDYMNVVWYRRELVIPDGWENQRVLLHFQASDYDTWVWANGVEVGRHRGGMTPFSCDLSAVVSPGEKLTLVVRVRDVASDAMPAGKQSWTHANMGCTYTRTTGIWQTVWLEPVPIRASLQRPKIAPDLANRCFRVEQPITGAQSGLRFRARLRDQAGEVSMAECKCGEMFYPRLDLPVPKERLRLWEPGNPHLYDIDLELMDESTGELVDQARSYAGLRSVSIDGMAVKINGRVLFQRLVLDQGYYPDGIMTAPSDTALEQDIRLALEAGFNGARLHEKVFEERFLYHADRLGYLVWGEFSDWGLAGREALREWHNDKTGNVVRGDNHRGNEFPPTYVTQWLEVLQRDYNHPCIIGWCPLNETHRRIDEIIAVHDDVMKAMWLATKLVDSTRPVIDASGYSHRLAESDVYDSHDYEQNPEILAARHARLADGEAYRNEHQILESIPWTGQPYFVSEFGGIWWNPEAAARGEASWGYGSRPRSEEEFFARFKGLCDALMDNSAMFGYCYTQLTDVFQEQNGLYFFDRQRKFDVARLRAVQERLAAIELLAEAESIAERDRASLQMV